MKDYILWILLVCILLVSVILCIPHIKAIKKYGKEDFLYYCRLEHISGLPIPKNAKCGSVFLKSGMVFTVLGQEYTLKGEKLVDVSVVRHKDIQKQYVSSIGKAVAGGLLFGPLGAIIGGSATKKSIKYNNKYLIVTYKENEGDSEPKYLAFDVTKNKWYQGLMHHYKYLKKETNVKVDL